MREPATYVGCTYQNCDNGTYHPYWAIDFNPPPEYQPGGPKEQEKVDVYSVGNGTAYITDISQDGSCSEVPPDWDPNGPLFSYPANQVAIDHGNGLITSYTHMDSILISNQQAVTKDTKLGAMGKAGVTFPCPPGFVHLHFETWSGASIGGPVNGLYYIQGGERVNPGTMIGCHDGTLVNYPRELGLSDWNSFDPFSGDKKWVHSS